MLGIKSRAFHRDSTICFLHYLKKHLVRMAGPHFRYKCLLKQLQVSSPKDRLSVKKG